MENQRFDIAHIRKYVNGELSAGEMYALERASHDDEMLMDLILGIQAEHANKPSFDRQGILQRIDDRAAASTPRKIRFLRPLSIAATIALVIGVGYYFMADRQQILVEHKLSHVEPAAPLPRDAADSTGTAEIKEEVSIMPDEQTIAVQQRSTNRKKKKTQVAEKKEVKDLPRITINETVPGIGDDNLHGIAAKKDSQRLAMREEPVNHSPIIEIHTNRESALATNARVNARKSHIADTLEENIYGFTTPPSSISAPYSISQVSSQTEIARTRQQVDGQLAEESLEKADQINESNHTPVIPPRRSEPIIGWNSYHDYLKKATAEYPNSNGSVTVSIEINNNGLPEHIQVLQSSSDTLSNLAISIIKQGPRWVMGRKYTDAKFKIDFNN